MTLIVGVPGIKNEQRGRNQFPASRMPADELEFAALLVADAQIVKGLSDTEPRGPLPGSCRY